MTRKVEVKLCKQRKIEEVKAPARRWIDLSEERSSEHCEQTLKWKIRWKQQERDVRRCRQELHKYGRWKQSWRLWKLLARIKWPKQSSTEEFWSEQMTSKLWRLWKSLAWMAKAIKHGRVVKWTNDSRIEWAMHNEMGLEWMSCEFNWWNGFWGHKLTKTPNIKLHSTSLRIRIEGIWYAYKHTKLPVHNTSLGADIAHDVNTIHIEQCNRLKRHAVRQSVCSILNFPMNIDATQDSKYHDVNERGVWLAALVVTQIESKEKAQYVSIWSLKPFSDNVSPMWGTQT